MSYTADWRVISREFRIEDREGEAGVKFASALSNYFKLVHAVEESESNSTVKAAARRNFINNLVTVIEVFLKDLIIQHTGRWNPAGIELLLKDQKLTLYEAFEFQTEFKLTKESLIIHKYNFQNLNDIDEIFSVLTKWPKLEQKQFLNGVTSSPLYHSVKTIRGYKDVFPNWRADLSKLFELRNRFIHEDDRTEVSIDEADKLHETVHFFGITINMYSHNSMPFN